MSLVQRERREETDELWRRLDDLVIDASELSLPRKPHILSQPPHTHTPPLQRTLRPEQLGLADEGGVLAQGRRGCSRKGFPGHRRSSRGGREHSSWEQRLHRRAG